MPLRLEDLVRSFQELRAGDAHPSFHLADHVLAVPHGLRQVGRSHPCRLTTDLEQASYRLDNRLDLVPHRRRRSLK
ncbi:hypothetical protein GCM10010251_20960 [Streptomyces aurantiogriseus]|uniref:Uncharacterized protein n=1 Tax=Streptomyces aurantiogriseus TaxID=66870 RepID=A0A918C4A1_9ACTN|nr:hypothetical protein GCM10010251_20960 [Streptomyces aurantiogriseus]